MQNNFTEPYRIFFPFGVLGSFIGTGVWIFPWLLNLNLIQKSIVNTYPVLKHVELLSGLFFLPIIVGFILTAIPRFVMGTSFLNNIGLGYFFILQSLLVSFSLIFPNRLLFYLLYCITFLSISIFILIKFFEAKTKISTYIYFSFVGTILGFLGGVVTLFSFYFQTHIWIGLGRHLLYYGLLPFVILSFGTKLIIPIIVGQNSNLKQSWMQKAESIPKQDVFIFSILYASTFVIEAFSIYLNLPNLQNLFGGIRLFLLSYWFYKYFHLKDYKAYTGTMPKTIYISIILFLVGLGGYAFSGRHSIHFAHIYFVSGLSLFVFSVMVRVILSHSGKDISIEKTSKIFYWFLFLLLLAGMTRATAHLFPEIFISHLAYASIVYTIFLMLWTFWIIKHLVKK